MKTIINYEAVVSGTAKEGEILLNQRDRWGDHFLRPFKVIKKLEADDVIWNIGDNFEFLKLGWVPVVKLNGFDVVKGSERALYVGVEAARLLVHASSWGFGNLKECRRRIARLEKSANCKNRAALCKRAMNQYLIFTEERAKK